MKKILIVTTLVLAATALIGGAVLARGPHGPGHGWRGPGHELMVERLAAELELSEAQVITLKEARTEARKERIRLRGEIELARLDMKELMGQVKPERRAVLKLHDEIQDLHARMARLGLEMRLTLKEVLTEEQQIRLRELRMEHRERRMERREDRMERRERRMERRGRGRGYGAGWDDPPAEDLDD